MRPSGHAEDCGGPVTSCEDAYAPTLRRIHACVARSGEEGVRHVWQHGVMLGPGATILLGDNGSGKSTLVEAIAAAWARQITSFRSDWLQQMVATPSGEDSDLHRALRIPTPAAGPPVGCSYVRSDSTPRPRHSPAGAAGPSASRPRCCIKATARGSYRCWAA